MCYTAVIADDEEDICLGLTEMIDWDDLGFRILASVSDGRDVIALLKTEKVDLVLTDIKMTFVSGLEVAEYIFTNNLPTRTLILTGYKEFDFAKKAIAYGVNDYLLKPTDMNELYAAIKKIKLFLDNKHQVEKAVSDATRAENEKAVIQKVKKFVSENYNKDITLQNAADHVYLSPIYLSRLFKQETGENFIDFVMRFRIEKAAYLLRTTELKIYEICDMVGYRNTKYFSTLFKKLMNASPIEYKEGNGSDRISKSQ